jgi:hypothetical protein
LLAQQLIPRVRKITVQRCSHGGRHNSRTVISVVYAVQANLRKNAVSPGLATTSRRWGEERTLRKSLASRTIGSKIRSFQRNSMGSIRKPTCATCLGGSPTTRLTASPICCPGTLMSDGGCAPQPEPRRQAKGRLRLGGDGDRCLRLREPVQPARPRRPLRLRRPRCSISLQRIKAMPWGS